MAKITYTNKDKTSSDPVIKKWRDVDANEVKASVNALYDATLGYTEKTATYVIVDGDFTINCTSGTFNVVLPTAVGIAGTIYNIKNSGTGVITVLPDGSETIDADSSKSLNQWNSLTVQSTGANWIII